MSPRKITIKMFKGELLLRNKGALLFIALGLTSDKYECT